MEQREDNEYCYVGLKRYINIFYDEHVHLVHSPILKCWKEGKKKNIGVNQHDDGPLTIHMSFSYGSNKWGWCDSYSWIDGPSKCVQNMPPKSIWKLIVW